MSDLSRLAEQASALTTAFVAARCAELAAQNCTTDRTPEQALAELTQALDRELALLTTAEATGK